MITSQINNKSIARIAAIQTLYQFAKNQENDDIKSILIRMKEFYKNSDIKSDHDIDQKSKLKLKPSYKYLQDLVTHTHQNVDTIDNVIKQYLNKEWSINNIPTLLHALLRVAICEIKYFPETPKKVILNEYTDIASDMLDESEIGFVNSFLHNYANSK